MMSLLQCTHREQDWLHGRDVSHLTVGCRFREKKAMAEAKEKFKGEIERFIALQYIFDKQWKAVRVSA